MNCVTQPRTRASSGRVQRVERPVTNWAFPPLRRGTACLNVINTAFRLPPGGKEPHLTCQGQFVSRCASTNSVC